MNTITVKSIEKRTFTPIERAEVAEKYKYGIGADLVKREICLYGTTFNSMLVNSTGDYLITEWGFDPDTDELTLMIFYRRYDAYILAIDGNHENDSITDYIKIFFKFDFTKDAAHVMDQIMFRCI